MGSRSSHSVTADNPIPPAAIEAALKKHMRGLARLGGLALAQKLSADELSELRLKQWRDRFRRLGIKPSKRSKQYRPPKTKQPKEAA
jgi:DNA/RNA-binding domain of Phe-tRNA-synthetase-like protein